MCPLIYDMHIFFNSRDKVRINFIKNPCAFYIFFKKKKKDTCHFYRSGLRKFLQPNLEENFFLSLGG